MRKTQFAGLTVLDPTESIYEDGGAFVARDRDEIDRALQIGVKLHRHDGSDGILDPDVAPSATVLASGGTIDSGLSVTIGYTLEDQNGGETVISPVDTVSTELPMSVPGYAPSATPDYGAGGTLTTDTYTYAVSYLDGEGGETPLGPSVVATRDPGYPNARIVVEHIAFDMAAAGATGWRLYRARGGREFVLLTEGSAADDDFIDDGSVEPDCDAHPLTENQNTTNKINRLQVTLPDGGRMDQAAVTFINLYASLDGTFAESSLLAQFPAGSAGQDAFFGSLDFLDSAPPLVNRSYGGANKIDPDTELIDWHWKRPVTGSGQLGSGELGDVRLVTGTGIFYFMPVSPSGTIDDWQARSLDNAIEVARGGSAVGLFEQIDFDAEDFEVIDNGDGSVTIVGSAGLGGGGGGGGLSSIPVEDEGVVQLFADSFDFRGAGVTVTDEGGGLARVTISSGSTTITTEDEGSTVTGADTIDFRGAGVEVTDQGGGVARVTITQEPWRDVHGFATGSATVRAYPGFWVSAESGVDIEIYRVLLWAPDGGDATATLRLDGSPLASFTDMAISGLAIGSLNGPEALYDEGYIDLDVTDVDGATSLAVTVIIKYTP